MISAIPPFTRRFFDPDQRFSMIGGGSAGGKATGLARVYETLQQDFDPTEFAEIEVDVPRLVVIGTDAFNAFMVHNDLHAITHDGLPDDHLAHIFQQAHLPVEILGDLRALIVDVHSPLAVRSSSLLEDALHEPFAGVYATKMIPNNQHSPDVRFQKLVEAIKFLYASTFFGAAKDYLKATRRRVVAEEMAVIIQEVLGQRHGDRFYPHLSGVARSYNYYARGRARPEDGVVHLALGLGKTIVDGGVSWMYSPVRPQVNPPVGSPAELFKLTQTTFWAVNMGKPPAYDPIRETEYLITAGLAEAERDGVLRYLASTFDPQSDRITPGMGRPGPRLLTFAPLLVWKEAPLNRLLKRLLALSEQAHDAPVEIEFAMVLDDPGTRPSQARARHRFGFLQARPMVVSSEQVEITPTDMTGQAVLLASDSVLGNGINNSICDIVYIPPERFDTTYCRRIALELARVNRRLLAEGLPYLLIGFGRWGSSDPWLGIPVVWGQVSGAKVIVEATRPGFAVELSQGSHFFHNLTSLQVSYFAVNYSSHFAIDWAWLAGLAGSEEGEFINHVALPEPLLVKVDGRSGRGCILKSAIEVAVYECN